MPEPLAGTRGWQHAPLFTYWSTHLRLSLAQSYTHARLSSLALKRLLLLALEVVGKNEGHLDTLRDAGMRVRVRRGRGRIRVVRVVVVREGVRRMGARGPAVTVRVRSEAAVLAEAELAQQDP
jgi:hypothetical protein